MLIDDLKTINLQEGITNIGYQAFDNCALEFEDNQLIIPNSVQKIGGRAFLNAFGNKHLESNANVAPLKIVLPNNLQTIEQWTFATSELNSLVISEFVMPKTVKEIKGFSLRFLMVQDFVYGGNLSDWQTINFEGSGTSPFTNYLKTDSTYQNIYFTIEGQKVRQNFAYNGYSLTRIDQEYFAATSPIIIEIPIGIQEIANNVLYNTGMTIDTVIIPASVNKISSWAFRCGTAEKSTKIKNVEYKGTVDQWAQLTFVDDFSNPMRGQVSGGLGGYFKFADFDSSTDKILEVGTTGSASFAINSYAFAYESIFPYVKIGTNVNDIKASAFNSASADVIVPADLEAIQEKAFASFAGTLCCMGSSANAGWVEGWDTKKDSTKISVTYNFDLNWLEAKLDPANAIFTFNGSTLTAIDYTVFDGADYVEIVIPEGVTAIKAQVFYNVAGMPAVIDRIVFPSTLTSFGTYMFKTAKYIGVEFNGTPDQWSQIAMPDNFANIFAHVDYTADGAYVRFGDYDSRTTDVLEIGVNGTEEFTIKTRAFRYLNVFNTIVIGQNVVGIETNAFAYADSASGEPTTNIYVNSSVITLGASVFANSYAVVNFEITEEEAANQTGWDASWKSSKKGNGTIKYGVTYTAA